MRIAGWMVGSVKRRGRVLVAMLAICAGGVLVSACGSDDDDSGGGGGGGEQAANSVRIVATSAADPGDVVSITGPIDYGKPFDLDVSLDDVTRFESHSTAAQVLLSGRADVLVGSFPSGLQLLQRGQDVRAFCPQQNATAEELIGTDDTKSIEDLKSDDTTLAIDSAGGAAHYFLSALLNEEDVGFTIDDLPNVTILEDGSQRLNAVQNGEADVSVLDFVETEALAKAIGKDRINVISTLAESIGDSALFQTFFATGEWLEENPDLAARLCAAVTQSARAATDDFSTFQSIAEKYIDPPPAEAELRRLWDLGSEHTVWPTDPVISKEQFDQNVEIALDSGLLEEAVAYEDAIAVDVMEEAKRLVEEQGTGG